MRRTTTGRRSVLTFRPPPARPVPGTVLTRSDACRVTSRATVLANLAARRWQTPVDGVVVLLNGALTHAERERSPSHRLRPEPFQVG